MTKMVKTEKVVLMALPPNDADFCTTREAAQLLQVSVKTAQLWVESGILQAWKTPGGHRRITRTSVQKLLQQRQHALGPADEQTPGRRHLLIVEDNPPTRRLYELTVSHWGLPLQLTMAENGFEGLMRLGEHRPDVLVTDLDMPGMNGFKMIASIQADPRYQSMRIVVVSGMTQPEITAAGGLPPRVTVLSKPIPFSELRKIIEGEILTSRP